MTPERIAELRAEIWHSMTSPESDASFTPAELMELLDTYAAHQQCKAQLSGWIESHGNIEKMHCAVSEELAQLKAQLPPEMQHCTIRFIECERGHGRLTATNWVQHGCLFCELEQLKAQIAAAPVATVRMYALIEGDEDLLIKAPSDCEHGQSVRLLREPPSVVEQEIDRLHETDGIGAQRGDPR